MVRGLIKDGSFREGRITISAYIARNAMHVLQFFNTSISKQSFLKDSRVVAEMLGGRVSKKKAALKATLFY